MTSSCFGKYWEGTEDSPCKEGKGCGNYNDCLVKFSTGKLVEYQSLLGPKGTPKELSKLAGVSPESILLAMNFQKNAGILVGPNEKEEEPENSLSIIQSGIEDIKAGRTRTLSMSELEEPEEIKEPPPEPKPRRGKKWDRKYDGSRWKRERRRSKVIGQLLPGMIIPFKYKNRYTKVVAEGTVVVHKGYYTYDEQYFPTLYSIMISIIGTRPYPKQKRADGTRPKGTRQMSSFSAVRFFKLKKFLGLEPSSKRKKK
jgi:hypothetical protein